MAHRLWVCGVFAFAAIGVSESTLAADPIEVKAKEDLSVRRGDRESGPAKERGIHPKIVTEKEKNELDRFSMIRFDSEEFDKDVRAVELTITARDEGTHKGRFRFRVYGVRDGDKEDEKITEKTYSPGDEGTLFDGSRNMVDRNQVVILGAITSEADKEVKLSSSSLTSFIRADTNGTVTLVIVRETEAGENSVFFDSKSEKPPVLKMLKRSDD